MEAGPHEQAWHDAGCLDTVAPLTAPALLAPPGLPPTLVLPCCLTVPREVVFGWARAEIGVQRCGQVVSLLRLRALVANRNADRLTGADVA